MSIVLTVHDKEVVLRDVIAGILSNTVGAFELVVVLDGCTDSSASIVEEYVARFPRVAWRVVVTPDVWEVRANNAGVRAATGDHVAIVQDDQVIDEPGWNARMMRPFVAFSDVFAVTGRAAHGWELNERAVDALDSPHRDDRWCDLLVAVDVADASNVPVDTFAVRDTVNRGPLVINREDLETMGCFDETFAPLDSDDHDLCYRMHATLRKEVGCVPVGWRSRPEWGGTRDGAGKTRPVMFLANHKNARLLYSRHASAMKVHRHEDRRLQ